MNRALESTSRSRDVESIVWRRKSFRDATYGHLASRHEVPHMDTSPRDTRCFIRTPRCPRRHPISQYKPQMGKGNAFIKGSVEFIPQPTWDLDDMDDLDRSPRPRTRFPSSTFCRTNARTVSRHTLRLQASTILNFTCSPGRRQASTSLSLTELLKKCKI